MATVLPPGGTALARQVRDRFADETAQLLSALPGRISAALEAPGAGKTISGKFEAMDAQAAFRQKSGTWLKAAQQEWQRKAQGRAADKTTGSGALEVKNDNLDGLALVDNAEVERTVIVGHLALAILNKARQELSELRARMQQLEGSADFVPGDIFRPETFAKVLIDAWADCGFTRSQWNLAQDAIHKHVAQGLGDAYAHANAFLTSQGVTAEIDLRTKVKRTPDRVTAPGRLSGPGGIPSVPSTVPGNLYQTGPSGGLGPSGYGVMASNPGSLIYAPPGGAGRAGYEAALYGSAGSGVVASAPVTGSVMYAPPGSPARTQYEAAIYGGGPGAGGAVAGWPVFAEGAAAPASGLGGGAPVAVMVSPLDVLQQQRAQGVLVDLRQFAERHGAVLAGGGIRPVSPVLALALAEPSAAAFQETQYQSPEEQDKAAPIGPADLGQAAEQIKSKAEALKDKTKRPDEKATIEIVSLMFQAILADERLPPALRVWFGRLQVPVLRVALAEPAFFAAPDHPARRLIDRMGACAMGLDSADVDGGRLEQEVKRIVQMIEQYPETGKKVFEIVLKEFEKFLGSAFTRDKSAQKFATLAQQIEQKDALAIQYTIELRNTLSSVPVSEEVRQFLFRVWSEVLALAAVRHGAQGAETMRLKQAAVDLLWAVSPKADRAERQQVTQYLPGILKTLREGMHSLAMRDDEQDGHIQLLSQAVAQAFHAPGQGITPKQMNELARALTGLEDVITDDPEGDLLLDPSLLEQMLGVDSANLQVISVGGARPDPDMLQWARGLQPGQWFTLRYQNARTRVQYVWHSARGQLHLFTTATGRSYLIQTWRLASYLQAGLIAPVEDEALTIRATRSVLTQLGQEPDLLLR
jgi:hypothetical protein